MAIILSNSNLQVLEKYIPEEYRIDPKSYIKLVKDQIMGRKGSFLDLTYFLQVSKNAQLDPSLKQIYAIFRKVNVGTKEKPNKIDKMTIVTGIDGFRSAAERTGNFAGVDEPQFGEMRTIEFVDDDNHRQTVSVPVYAVVAVNKVIQGNVFKTFGRADWTEFYPGDYLGAMWRKMPHIMLAKCAEAQAHRKAFPILSGIYVKEELEQADREENATDLKVLEEVKEIDLSDEQYKQIEEAQTREELIKVYQEIKANTDARLHKKLTQACSARKAEIEEQPVKVEEVKN